MSALVGIQFPTNWNIDKLARQLEMIVGWTPPSGNDLFYGTGFDWVNISDISGRRLGSTHRQITQLAIKTAKMRLVPTDSLLFSFKLSVGKVTFVAEPVYTNEAIAAFLPTSKLDLGYAYYMLPPILLEQAGTNIYGAAILNQELIRGARIPVPPLEEQRAIADFLDRETAEIDAFIADQERLIELLTERRTATITHAVTKGLDPSAPMRDSGIPWLGQIPAHWSVTALRRRGRMQTGSTPSKESEALFFRKGGFPWVRPQDYRQGAVISSASMGLTPEGVSQVSIVKARSALVSCIGAGSIGKVGFSEVECCTNQQITAFTSDSYEYAEFDFYSLVAAYEELVSLAPTNRLPILNNDRLGDLQVTVPPADEALGIAAYLNRKAFEFNELVDDAKRTIELSKERRAALISAAVTGQIDVRTHA